MWRSGERLRFPPVTALTWSGSADPQTRSSLFPTISELSAAETRKDADATEEQLRETREFFAPSPDDPDFGWISGKRFWLFGAVFDSKLSRTMTTTAKTVTDAVSSGSSGSSSSSSSGGEGSSSSSGDGSSSSSESRSGSKSSSSSSSSGATS